MAAPPVEDWAAEVAPVSAAAAPAAAPAATTGGFEDWSATKTTEDWSAPAPAGDQWGGGAENWS